MGLPIKMNLPKRYPFKKAISSLKASIKKWIDISKGTEASFGRLNCACCVAFLDDCCNNCPIRFFAGYVFCGQTPYDSWRACHVNVIGGYDIYNSNIATSEAKKIADDEVDFLKTVLKRLLEEERKAKK